MKKIINFILDTLLILIIIGIIYYFYTTTQNNSSLLENGILPYVTSTSDNSASILNEITFNNNQNNNVISDNSNIAKYYYYNQLDHNAKLIYSSLENNITYLTQSNYKIDFGTQFNDLLNQSNGKNLLDKTFQSALDAFFYDHPELFYLDLTKISLMTRSTSFGNKTTYKVSLEPTNGNNYLANYFTNQSVQSAIVQVESLKNGIINQLSGNDYNKVLTVHDTLADLIEYDTSYTRTNTHNIYGALIEHKVVCEGYAKSFKYIMDALNIPCILVSGTATNSSGKTESHMWNYVQLNGNWYGVDLTWDDPVVVGGPSKNIIRHNYFLKGSVTFSNSHKIENKISDTGMSFNYPNLSSNNYQ